MGNSLRTDRTGRVDLHISSVFRRGDGKLSSHAPNPSCKSILQIHPDVLRFGDPATIQAAEVLVKVLTTPEWGTKKFQAGKMTRQTLDQFNPYQHIPEVKQLVDAIQSKTPVDGLMLHYLKRRYVEQEAINHPDDLRRNRPAHQRL